MGKLGQHDDFRLNDSFCRTYSSKLSRLMHWGPIIGLSIVIFLAIMSLYCIQATVSPVSRAFGLLNIVFICIEFIVIMRGYLYAAWLGPGFAKLSWKPRNANDHTKLQYCALCEGYKPPRSHHCSKCGRCVLKMDHHCPWINCCVGHLNHGMFLHFIISAPIGCIHCSALCIWHVYFVFTRAYFLFRRGYNVGIIFSFYEIFVVLMALGLAFGVILAVGGLAYCQLRSIARNETAIENWIKTKAEDRRRDEGEPPFVYPYDLGCWKNTSQVITFSGYPVGDGYTWPLKPGCGEYDLTIEQLKQKEAKSRIAREVVIHRAYSGGLFSAFAFGPRVACCFPWSGEGQLRVQVGDRVLVTRSYRRWIYGQLLVNPDQQNGTVVKHNPRGWFPRACTKETQPKAKSI